MDTGLHAGASGGANKCTTFDARSGSSGSSFALTSEALDDAAPWPVGIVALGAAKRLLSRDGDKGRCIEDAGRTGLWGMVLGTCARWPCMRALAEDGLSVGCMAEGEQASGCVRHLSRC